MFNSPNSAALYARACKSLAVGVSSVFRRYSTPSPLYMERGDGPYYYDVDGHELLDYTLAWGPLILGNNHPAVNEAVTRQLGRAYTYGAQHRGEIELAELMVEVLPGVERVLFSNTGTEAVQAALRISRAFSGRSKIVKFEGHYHGWMNNIKVSVDNISGKPGKTLPETGGQPAGEYAETIALPWNDLEALERIFIENPDQIACVITEPVNANSGSCMPGDDFLAGLIELCRKYGAVSIFDEVITGFRLALGGAREYFGLKPDLSVYAKAIAAGFSMAAVGGRAELFDVLVDGRTTHAGTYNGGPICTAATVATIRVLSEPGLFDRMHAHGYAIREAIENAARENGKTLVTTGTGTCFSALFGLTSPPRNASEFMQADHETSAAFQAQMLDHGILLLPKGRWYVGAVHTEKELARVLPAVRESMRAIAKS